MRDASIYVHIPFCKKKCAYCDFASFPGREGEYLRYCLALKEEIGREADRYGSFTAPSVFFGGGTPTALLPEQLAELLHAICSRFRVQPDGEITLEANPGTVTGEGLRLLRNAGFNRISFGAQAFQDRILEKLGRIHRAKEIFEAVEMARGAGFARISLDLMYGLPEQSLGDWEESLQAAVETGVEHVSCYSLILEEGTPMTEKVRRGEVEMPGEETVLCMQRQAAGLLAQYGLARYEISNYARPGCESRHNARYWRRGDYLGVGCAAHSLMEGQRFHNPETLEGYFAGERHLDAERLTPEEEIEEAVMLETRCVRGIDLRAFRQRYQVDFESRFAKGIEKLTAGGFARAEGGRFFLTDRGMDVQNAVVLALLEGEMSEHAVSRREEE